MKLQNLSRRTSSPSFHHILSEKGILFTVLFYILLALFLLQLITILFISLFKLNFLIFILPLLLGTLTAYLIKKRNLYNLLTTIFLLSPIGFFIILNFLYIPTATIIEYLLGGHLAFHLMLISIHTLILGLLAAYMFSKVSGSFKKHLASGIILSSGLGLIFAISGGLITLVEGVIRITTLASELLDSGYFTVSWQPEFPLLFSSIFFYTTIAFAFAFIFFNIPYVIFYSKRKDKNPKLFLLYSIPILVFILLFVILRYVVITHALGTTMLTIHELMMEGFAAQ